MGGADTTYGNEHSIQGESEWAVESKQYTARTRAGMCFFLSYNTQHDKLALVGDYCDQCPPGTWICKTGKIVLFSSPWYHGVMALNLWRVVINTRPSHSSEPPRVLQVIPVAGDIEETKNTKESFGVYAQFGQSWSQRADDDRSFSF